MIKGEKAEIFFHRFGGNKSVKKTKYQSNTPLHFVEKYYMMNVNRVWVAVRTDKHGTEFEFRAINSKISTLNGKEMYDFFLYLFMKEEV